MPGLYDKNEMSERKRRTMSNAKCFFFFYNKSILPYYIDVALIQMFSSWCVMATLHFLLVSAIFLFFQRF